MILAGCVPYRKPSRSPMLWQRDLRTRGATGGMVCGTYGEDCPSWQQICSFRSHEDLLSWYWPCLALHATTIHVDHVLALVFHAVHSLHLNLHLPGGGVYCQTIQEDLHQCHWGLCPPLPFGGYRRTPGWQWCLRGNHHQYCHCFNSIHVWIALCYLQAGRIHVVSIDIFPPPRIH